MDDQSKMPRSRPQRNHVLAAEVSGLRDLFASEIKHLNERLEEIEAAIVPGAEFRALTIRVKAIEENSNYHLLKKQIEDFERDCERRDKKMEWIQRVVWLEVGVFTVFVAPVIVAILIQWISGLL